MTQLLKVDENVIGVVLVSAEGMADLSDHDKETWIRDATPTEKDLFVEDCKRVAQSHNNTFDFGNFAVDGNGRPYWLMTFLEHENTPAIAKKKAIEYTRVMRISQEY